MRKIILSFLCLFAINLCIAQDLEKYSELTKEALSLYESGEYRQSGLKYSDAFVARGGKGLVTDRYNAACSWALAKEKDSAFVQLFRIAEKGNYKNLGHITTDPDLKSLHDDQRWEEVINMVKTNKDKAEANLDKTLVAMLDSIYEEDQKYRRQIKGIEEKYGWESEEMKAHWKLINEKDSVNLIKIKRILDERGWLGSDVIGGKGNTTLFLVIQHADLETQEKYLPLMRTAVQKGDARASSLALLEDRVALRKGEKQIYGSQVGRDPETGEYYVLPLIDPDNVDRRRAEMGLGTIQDYISGWDMEWDVEDYKRKLPEYEARRKR